MPLVFFFFGEFRFSLIKKSLAQQNTYESSLWHAELFFKKYFLFSLFHRWNFYGNFWFGSHFDTESHHRKKHSRLSFCDVICPEKYKHLTKTQMGMHEL
jgi:hypothetical protein